MAEHGLNFNSEVVRMQTPKFAAIHQFRQLLSQQVAHRQLMDSFYLFQQGCAKLEDIERMAVYLNQQQVLIPSTQCIEQHVRKIQAELKVIEQQVNYLRHLLIEYGLANSNTLIN